MLECLKNCWKNVSELANIYWKHVLECLKIGFEKVEKRCKKVEKKLKKVENSWKKLKKCWKMFLETC